MRIAVSVLIDALQKLPTPSRVGERRVVSILQPYTLRVIDVKSFVPIEHLNFVSVLGRHGLEWEIEIPSK